MATERELRTLCFDFDGVINSYKSGWNANDVTDLPDKPVWHTFKMMHLYVQHNFILAVFSGRSQIPRGIGAMQDYIGYWDDIYRENVDLFVDDSKRQNLSPIIDSMFFPENKPGALIYFDDKGFRFNGKNLPSIEELLQLSIPWHKE